MIDEQKLLKWIEDKRYVYEGPYNNSESPSKIAELTGKVQLLNLLERDIELGEFKQE